jgi:hypothetical protein
MLYVLEVDVCDMACMYMANLHLFIAFDNYILYTCKDLWNVNKL